MRNAFLAIACVSVVAMIPALYLGAWLAQVTNNIFVLPIPVILCTFLAGYAVEQAEYPR